MQRSGDFRMGKRSTAETFNEDLYAFPPATRSPPATSDSPCRPDHAPHLGGAEEARHHRPRRPPPSTIMYYPEIKMYANKPVFLDRHFRVSGNVFMVGDGAARAASPAPGRAASGRRRGYWAGTDSGRSLPCRLRQISEISSSYSRDTVCLSPTTVRVFQWPLR